MKHLALAALALLAVSHASATAQGAVRGSYPKLEAAFSIAGLASDPFDYTETDVRAQVLGPRTSVSAPAFFDGGTTWRVRYTPTRAGRYRIGSITLNGHALAGVNAQPSRWVVSGAASPGFVRVDKASPKYFRFDNGARYFPVGHNVAWKNGGDPPIPQMFAKMGAARENWSRVWMDAWDGKNLDWPSVGKLGQLNLEAARRWDAVVEAAQKNGIYFQMVLQHHGQYSTTTDPNWNDNPYNVKNGGFLLKPEDFFTDAQAKSLTKRKLRYACARWGYSPAILAWELFNEVQYTNAAKANQWSLVGAWHEEMAAFLRAEDPNRHLITTSSELDKPIWSGTDYFQHHDYPSDVVGYSRDPEGVTGRESKPIFAGEVGIGEALPHSMRAVLWASLMSNQSGAAQPWYWDIIEKQNLYPLFTSVQNFLSASGLPSHEHLVKTEPHVQSSVRTDLALRPGLGWARAEQSEFVLNTSLDADIKPDLLAKSLSFLQGTNHRDMNPSPLSLRFNQSRASHLTVHIAQIAKAGAHLKLALDGQVFAERDFPAADADQKVDVALPIEIPAGAHVITVENSGQDWVVLRDITLDNAVGALGAYGLSDGSWAAMWVFHRTQLQDPKASVALSGQVLVQGLRPGNYRAVWWDTDAGRPIKSERLSIGALPVLLDTPPIVRDAALYIVR